jgi:hypothetical protein
MIVRTVSSVEGNFQDRFRMDHHKCTPAINQQTDYANGKID